MRVINPTENKSEVDSLTANINFQSVNPMTHKSYHELADVPVVEKDVLGQLHANLAILEDMQGRFSFLMKEIRYLMKV